MKIIIYDAHPIMRDGLEHLVTTRGDSLITSTSNADQLVAAVNTGQADLLIIDPLSLPALALDDLQRVALNGKPLRCLVFTASESAAWLLRGTSLSLQGCLHKREGIDAINEALTFLAGKRDKALPEPRFLQYQGKQILAAHCSLAALTRRELQILRQLGLGLTNKMIADEMGLSHKTISTYKRNMMKKLRTRNVSELLGFAQQRGFG